MMNVNRSQESSPFNFALDVGIELLPCNGLGIESSNCVDDLPELVLVVAVFQLLVNILQIVNVQFTFSFNVQKGEVCLSSFIIEWASLNYSKSYDSCGKFPEESFKV